MQPIFKDCVLKDPKPESGRSNSSTTNVPCVWKTDQKLGAFNKTGQGWRCDVPGSDPSFPSMNPGADTCEIIANGTGLEMKSPDGYSTSQAIRPPGTPAPAAAPAPTQAPGTPQPPNPPRWNPTAARWESPKRSTRMY